MYIYVMYVFSSSSCDVTTFALHSLHLNDKMTPPPPRTSHFLCAVFDELLSHCRQMRDFFHRVFNLLFSFCFNQKKIRYAYKTKRSLWISDFSKPRIDR